MYSRCLKTVTSSCVDDSNEDESRSPKHVDTSFPLSTVSHFCTLSISVVDIGEGSMISL
jgi:hypothetical protein